MKYRKLGKTDLEVSVVGVGTYQFGGEWGKDFNQKEVKAILGTARDCGINLIDTAECYGDHVSESLIGKYIQSERDQWIIATKFGHKFHGFQKRTRHWTLQEVLKQLDDSLRALKTDYIDIYQFHSPRDEELNTEGLWEMLTRQVEAGKIRHLGVSLSGKTSPESKEYQITRAFDLDAKVIQIAYSRLDRMPEQTLLPLCQKLDRGVLARVPLASGLLSGKYNPGTQFPANDVRSTRDQAQQEATLRQVEEIKAKEVPEGVTMATWALAWCLKHPAVACVIPGCKSPDHVRQNAGAANLDMVSLDHPLSIRE
jgi:aryl-alcohol dehydrogenase-like predicted oxidoreductase